MTSICDRKVASKNAQDIFLECEFEEDCMSENPIIDLKPRRCSSDSQKAKNSLRNKGNVAECHKLALLQELADLHCEKSNQHHLRVSTLATSVQCSKDGKSSLTQSPPRNTKLNHSFNSFPIEMAIDDKTFFKSHTLKGKTAKVTEKIHAMLQKLAQRRTKNHMMPEMLVTMKDITATN